MAFQNLNVSRNVDAKDEHGRDVKIALATITHDNGVLQTVAIREDLIQFAGEDIIAEEVAKAVSSPQKPQLDFDPKKARPLI